MTNSFLLLKYVHGLVVDKVFLNSGIEATEKIKTTHNGNIIGSIMHAMFTKSCCGTIINKERGESGIII
jgi:hypothetical protein